MKPGAGMRVLVTAGAEKQSLAAVRSLGRAGSVVEVLDPKPDAPAFRSRYCAARYLSPSNRDRDAYLEFLLSRVRAQQYTTILACDDLSATYLSEEQSAFAPYVALALPPRESFRRATDKSEIVALAAELGLPVPRTLRPRSAGEAEAMAAELGYPVIVKGHHGWGAQHVRLVREPRLLHGHFAEVAGLEAALGAGPPMLQEYVHGVGYGFSTLFRHGEPRAAFQHRRTAEYDVLSGGKPYSCPMAVSVHDPDLERQALRLFAALGWHGLGMAEWRRENGSGRYFLMEVNPRLVGSTDLAMRSGVDLPFLACQMVRDGDVEPVLEHRVGVRMRWLLPDALRDLLARPSRLFDLETWKSATDWSWRDLAPHVMQLRLTAWALRHPH
jgi:predicted ATP-grasp superfamily ATP-dependent carboligase